MKIMCAHCQAEGKPGVLGEMEPFEGVRVSLPVIGWAPQFPGTALQGMAR